MENNPQINTAGVTAMCLSALNSFFQVLNPILTGIFYVASITWLIVQIYYKMKPKK
jgi:hypothetical protein